MFQTLKQKIAKETGQDISKLNFNNKTTKTSSTSNQSARNSISSNRSTSFDSSREDDLQTVEERESEVDMLRQELSIALEKIKILEEEKKNLDVSKNLFFEETDRVQNAQQHEIDKLRSLLLFREQVNLTCDCSTWCVLAKVFNCLT